MLKTSKEMLNDVENDLIFTEILESEDIVTYYQPIVSLISGEIIGYEALSRGPMHTVFYSPLELIKKAHQTGKLWELETLFRKKALQGLQALKPKQLMFINVDPEIIKDEEYIKGSTKELLLANAGSTNNIVFEITERTAIYDYDAFIEIINNYREQSYQIAVDDVGAGHSGLLTINEIRPNYIKIDMALIRNIDKDAFKQALIKAFVDSSSVTNIRVIAEGIETPEELKTLIMLGVHAGQGYYLGKPIDKFIDVPPLVLENIEKYNQISRNLNDYSQDYHYISNLVEERDNIVFESMTPSITVKNRIDASESRSATICERSRPVGLVMRYKIDASLSGQFGFSLYSNSPVSKVMDHEPLIVDCYQPINVVAKCAMERIDYKLFDDIIVTKSGSYYGTVQMKKIFEYTLMFEKNYAKDHNPLTGLPGNVIIKRVLADVLESDRDACVMYVDINEFKVYNDVYGFENGDLMIKYLADTLQELVKARYPYQSFVGHVGGDDFVIVVEDELSGYDVLGKAIIDSFERDKLSFFNDTHSQSGVIVAKDRFGIERQLPLTSLSVSAVYGDFGQLVRTDILTSYLANAKKKVKESGVSRYRIYRVGELAAMSEMR